MIRNKVMWQKNIRPSGAVDWVIIGFNALTSVERKVGAKVDTSETFEKQDEVQRDVSSTGAHITKGVTTEKHVSCVITGEGSKKYDITTAEEETTTAKSITKETAAFEKADLAHEVVESSSYEKHTSHEGSLKAIVFELLEESESMPLKDMRERSVKEAQLTAVETFKPSKWLSQTTPATSKYTLVTTAKNGGESCLKEEGNESQITIPPSSTPKRARSNSNSRNASPNSSPMKEAHPAEILKTWYRTIHTTSENKSDPKTTHNTSDCSKNISKSCATRPRSSASVASRMITHALGLRAASHVRETEIRV